MHAIFSRARKDPPYALRVFALRLPLITIVDIVVLRKTIFLLLAILAFALQMEFLYAIHLFQIVFIMPELMNVLRSLTLNGA